MTGSAETRAADSAEPEVELVVGIDVGKAELVLAVWDRAQQGGRVLEPLANTEAGCGQLAQVLAEEARRQGAHVIHLTAEPTGGYESVLVAFAHAQGWRVSLVNALTVRDWAKGLGRRAKTDQLDALMLAHYTVERQPVCGSRPAKRCASWTAC